MPASMDTLVNAEPDLRADAMLWPHHGHEPDSVGRFAAAVGAKVLVTSSGKSFDPEPLPAWAKVRGIACYHTASRGP